MHYVSVEGLTKSYGIHPLFRNITFHLNEGDKIAIIARNGIGKSTLLRIAANLEANTGGSCSVDRDSIGYVFQDPTLMPWRTVQRNIELIAELHKVPKAERKSLAEEAISLVGLKGFEDRYPRQLSGGITDMVVDGRTGLLVAPGDPAALSEALATLLAQPETARSFGVAGRDRAREFTVSAVAPRIEQMYVDAIESKVD
jgi:ABC-type nitrate/sulfonate/bicarbonate transport system ATPase subunit